MSERNHKVDIHVTQAKRWNRELHLLRDILLASELVEEYKWGAPCYTLNGANVAIVYEFKEAVGIGFFKGSLMTDPAGLLQSPGENSQAVRIVKFTDTAGITRAAATLGDYLAEAAAIERSGRKVPSSVPAVLPYPQEFIDRRQSDPALAAAFEALTPGRKRAYSIYFTAAKQAKTRLERIERCVPKILAGQGPDE